MRKYQVLILLWGGLGLLSCTPLGGLWTGASLVYDRHNLYKQFNDYELSAAAHRALFRDKFFKNDACSLDIAALNGDLLIAGHVATETQRQEVTARLGRLPGMRRFFNQLAVGKPEDALIEDNWITAKIRSQLVADSDIDPKQFKVITSDRIVYLLGDVAAEQADRVINIARQTEGVKRVVKLLRIYTFTR